MRKIKIALLLTALSVIGFFREFLFANLNLRYYQVLYQPGDTFRSDLIAIFDPLNGMQLYWLKWALTIFFALLFFFFGGLVLKLWLQKPVWKVFGGLYAALFTIGGSSYLILLALGNPESGYTIARFFMGLAQSPFPVVFMIPALYLKS